MHRLWKTYKHVVHLRSVDQSNPEKVKPEQYAVLVRDIPAPVPGSGTIYDQVDKYFKALHPETYRACVIVTKISNVCTQRSHNLCKSVQTIRVLPYLSEFMV